MAKVIFRNSDFRHYRIPFYDALCEKHQVKFIFRFNQVPEKYEYISVCEGKLSFWADKRFLINYLKWLMGDFDVFIASLPSHPISMIGIVITKLRSKKVIIWLEGWIEPSRNRIKDKIKYFYYKQVLIRADGYYVTSTKSENFIKNFIRKKNTLIFKALQANIDMSQFRPKQLKIDLPQNHFIFLYFGRIIDWKGLDILLEAFEKVNQKFTDSTLLVIGDGDFKKECLKLVEDKKINNIIFEQPINDEDNEAKVGVYQVCDVFILPSTIIKNQSEGWGLTVGEAMSLGKPVIVTDAVGCCADLVENGTNGFVVKHGSATDLECAMLKAIEAKENLHVMGRKSRKYFEERVSHKKMAAALNEAISKV